MAMTSPFYFPRVSISSCAVCCFVEACIMPLTSVVVLFLFDKVPYKTSQPVIMLSMTTKVVTNHIMMLHAIAASTQEGRAQEIMCSETHLVLAVSEFLESASSADSGNMVEVMLKGALRSEMNLADNTAHGLQGFDFEQFLKIFCIEQTIELSYSLQRNTP